MTNKKTLNISNVEADTKCFFKIKKNYIELSSSLAGGNDYLQSFVDNNLAKLNPLNFCRKSLQDTNNGIFCYLCECAYAQFTKKKDKDTLQMIIDGLHTIRFGNMNRLEFNYPHLVGEYWLRAD